MRWCGVARFRGEWIFFWTIGAGGTLSRGRMNVQPLAGQGRVSRWLCGAALACPWSNETGVGQSLLAAMEMRDPRATNSEDAGVDCPF